MPHRDPEHVYRVRYSRHVDRFRHHAATMTYDELSRIIKDYEDDVGRFELVLGRLGLIHEPAHIAAYRLERAGKKHHNK